MIKLLFGYGREWTVILGAVDGLQNCPTKGIKLGKALARSRHTLFYLNARGTGSSSLS